MTKDEALKLALEALDDIRLVDLNAEQEKAIAAIKEALAEPDAHNEQIKENNKNAKYELIQTDTREFNRRTLYRIRALVSIGTLVSPGDLGGYIEKESNLSVSGDAWVYGSAWVYGNARVSGDARVSGNAWVYGDAQVYGDAWVYGNARVYGNAQVYGDAQVSGNAWVCGDARVSNYKEWLLIGPAKSFDRFTTSFIDEKLGVRVVCGSFTGSLTEFSERIEETHKNNQKALEQYRLFCQLIAFSFEVKS